MTRIYGASLLINSLVILLLAAVQTYVAIGSALSYGPQLTLFVTLGISTLLGFLGYKFFQRSVCALKGTLSISSPATVFKKIVFYVGFTLLVLSAAIHLATITLIGYLAVTKTVGVPAGMGSGLGLVVFILSAFLLGPTLKTHNSSLQPTGYASG